MVFIVGTAHNITLKSQTCASACFVVTFIQWKGIGGEEDGSKESQEFNKQQKQWDKVTAYNYYKTSSGTIFTGENYFNVIPKDLSQASVSHYILYSYVNESKQKKIKFWHVSKRSAKRTICTKCNPKSPNNKGLTVVLRVFTLCAAGVVAEQKTPVNTFQLCILFRFYT